MAKGKTRPLTNGKRLNKKKITNRFHESSGKRLGWNHETAIGWRSKNSKLMIEMNQQNAVKNHAD